MRVKYVALSAFIACLAFFQTAQGQVPTDVQVDRVDHQYDIGITEEVVREVPADKADTIVVRSATWCAPCQRMKPNWKTLKSEGYRVVVIDVNKPVWTKPEDEELVKKYAAPEDSSVPDVYLINSSTGEVVKEYHQYVELKKVREDLWKTSSSRDSARQVWQ